MIRRGTCYFANYGYAYAYYRDCEWINYKLQTGEIHIGKPPLNDGESCYIGDDGRYVIRSPEATDQPAESTEV